MQKRNCSVHLLYGLEFFWLKVYPIFFALAVLVLFSHQASASVSLLDVVKTALEQASGVQLQRENLRSSESDVLAARSAFDPQVSLSFGYRHDALSAFSGSDLKTVTSTLSSSTLLPSGLIIQPSILVEGHSASGAVSSSVASSGITFTLPLMEGFGENSLRTALSANRKVYQAERYALQHAVSTTIYGAALAYWNYLYAYQALKLDQQLREKAEESYRATQALAGAGEIALVRSEQAHAYLQQAEVAEVSSAQLLRQSWNALFLAMGTSLAGREKPEEPADLFPLPDNDLSMLTDISELQAHALAFRADLQVLQLQGEAANDLLSGSRNRMKPKVDLDLWAGYSGQHSGSSVTDYLSSVASEVPGLNVSATLRYTFQARNSSDEAAFLRSRSQYEKTVITRQDLERSITSGVGLAADAVGNAASVWRLSMQSTRTYRLLYAAELKKYKMGMSDLFKVQSVSTDLASAEKQLLGAEKAYAVSLLALRFEAAWITRERDGSYGIEQQDLMTLPALKISRNKP
ncbi:MAG: TolC family protein [Chlorobium sp.]